MRRTIRLTVSLSSVFVVGWNSVAAAQAQRDVRFGTEPNYAPFEFKTPEGTLAGFDIELGSALCAAANLNCSWVESTFDGLIPALKARKFDVINSEFSATEARAKVISFSNMLYDVNRRLVAKKGSTLLPTAQSLKGKTVGVTQGSIEELFIIKYWVPSGVRLTTYQTQDLVYADLAAGRIDATLQNTQSARKGFLSKPDGAGFDYVGPPVFDHSTLGAGIALGFRNEDTELIKTFNGAMAKVKADGTMDRLIKKYFPPDVISVK